MIPATLCALLAIGLAFRLPWDMNPSTVEEHVLGAVLFASAGAYVLWFLANWRASKEDL